MRILTNNENIIEQLKEKNPEYLAYATGNQFLEHLKSDNITDAYLKYQQESIISYIKNQNNMPTVPTVAGVLDADMRSGCEAVEHRTAWRPSTKGTPPARGEFMVSITHELMCSVFNPHQSLAIPAFLSTQPFSKSLCSCS